MPWMLDEIHQQSEAVKRVLEKEAVKVRELVTQLKQRSVNHVLIAARGTSDHAAIYAKYLIEIVCGIPVTLAAPSVFTMYHARLTLKNTLALGISQSGQSEDVVKTLSAARSGGAVTACITNAANAPITDECDFVLSCQAGEERSVAATKTYTCSLALIALLAAYWSESSRLCTALETLPALMEQALTMDDFIHESVIRYRYMQECAVISRGINLATAMETALKITETSYLVSRPFSGADFMHGPIAMIAQGFPVILFMPEGGSMPSLMELAINLKSKSAELIVCSHNREALELAQTAIYFPLEIEELISPIAYILAGQLWACHLACVRGIDPDRPRGLSKVTSTL